MDITYDQFEHGIAEFRHRIKAGKAAMELKADTTRRYQGEPIAAYDDSVKRFATDASSTTLHLQKTTKFLNLKMEEKDTFENCIFEFDNNWEKRLTDLREDVRSSLPMKHGRIRQFDSLRGQGRGIRMQKDRQSTIKNIFSQT